MTIADLFRRHAPESELVAAAGLCTHCGGASGHPILDGDGAAVCLPCIYRLGRAASDPASIPEHQRLELLAAHDAVDLARAVFSRRLAWAWNLPWPTDDTTLASEEERMAWRLHFHCHQTHLVPGCVHCEAGRGGMVPA